MVKNCKNTTAATFLTMCEFEYNYHYVMVLEQIGIVRSLWQKILLSFCIKFCENTNECVPIWWYGGVSAPREKTYHKVTRWYAPSFSIFGRFYANCATGLSLLLKNQSLCLKLAADAAALSQTQFFSSNWTNHCGIKPHKTCEMFPKKSLHAFKFRPSSLLGKVHSNIFQP